MDNYTEIIDALRHCAEDGFDSCDACPYAAAPESCAGMAKKAAEAIEKLSAADVRPVVRGKWTKSEYDGSLHALYMCSQCGSAIGCDKGTPRENGLNFCPNCGADMREEPAKEET